MRMRGILPSFFQLKVNQCPSHGTWSSFEHVEPYSIDIVWCFKGISDSVFVLSSFWMIVLVINCGSSSSFASCLTFSFAFIRIICWKFRSILSAIISIWSWPSFNNKACQAVLMYASLSFEVNGRRINKLLSFWSWASLKFIEQQNDQNKRKHKIDSSTKNKRLFTNFWTIDFKKFQYRLWYNMCLCKTLTFVLK